LLEARGLGVTVARNALLTDIDLELHTGEVLAVVGENGAGKSTLLRVLSGELRPSNGHVTLAGKALGNHSPLELARRRAVLSQDQQVSFSFTALEVARMGRHPHGETRATEIALEMLRLCDAAQLEGRVFATLSGGERQRVQLARTLAQVWDVPDALLLLDEPTSQLDIKHQQATLRMARQAAERGAAVLVILHDLNLAAMSADRIVMLSHGRLVASGRPWEVLTADRIERVFGASVRVIPHPETHQPLIVSSFR
jgi:iron complex transport system ATP-binding protein